MTTASATLPKHFSIEPDRLQAALAMLTRVETQYRPLALQQAIRLAEAIQDIGQIADGHIDILLDSEMPTVALIAQVPDRMARTVATLLGRGPFVFRFADYQGRSLPGVVTHGAAAMNAMGNAPCAVILGDRMASWVAAPQWYAPIHRCLDAGYPIGVSPSHPASVELFQMALCRSTTRVGLPKFHGDCASRQLRSLVEFLERDGECQDVSMIARPFGQRRIYLIDGHFLDTTNLQVYIDGDEDLPTLASILPLSGVIPPYLHPSEGIGDRPLFDRAMWVKSIFDWMHSTVMPELETANGLGR